MAPLPGKKRKQNEENIRNETIQTMYLWTIINTY